MHIVCVNQNTLQNSFNYLKKHTFHINFPEGIILVHILWEQKFWDLSDSVEGTPWNRCPNPQAATVSFLLMKKSASNS